MRDLHELDVYRLTDARVIEVHGGIGDAYSGAFVMQSPIDGRDLVIVASADAGWDHVSISRQNRVPNWTEMEHVKRAFFRDDEVAMQLHVPPGNHVNIHPHCLHLWRPHNQPIPLPPQIFV